MYYYGVCMYLSICEQMCSYVCACMVCTFEYVSEGIYVCVCVCHMSICIYMNVCTCVSVSVHMECAYVCICMHR